MRKETKSGPARPRRSSRPPRHEDLDRIHQVRRKLEHERKRLGMTPGEYLVHTAQELRKKGYLFSRFFRSHQDPETAGFNEPAVSF